MGIDHVICIGKIYILSEITQNHVTKIDISIDHVIDIENNHVIKIDWNINHVISTRSIDRHLICLKWSCQWCLVKPQKL
uniref:Uncharacterized protein n=1 Tax=Romanomermis culicivorax TaxID=13658 RepID=A0A915L3F9_ROMCU